ncbi:MAG TPA: aminotransferase class V-fold PLP-dependent enzyme [Humisphaera sp.]|nr:aminotransferase class V-fold PLP-dependent enzyme [Humisphaera sp.]
MNPDPHPNAPIKPPPPLRNDIAAEFMLRPDITFLNHGSFGAVPRVVFDAQMEWRRRLEAEPVELLAPARRGTELLQATKEPVAALLGMASNDFGLVTNATEGINAVLRSLPLSKEPAERNELLTTTHVYGAVRKAMQFVADRDGWTYREVDVPLPVSSSAQIAERIIGALSHHTRLLVIDHVTSPTALIFPVEEIAAECGRRGIEILVDGAHAPGMLELNVPKIGATYYAGNLHKWCCAPKGCGFLWVNRAHQQHVHPLIISHHLGEGFTPEFGWQGTRDVSAWLTIPAALQYMAAMRWERIRRHNHELAVWAHRVLLDRLNVRPISPIDGSLLGSMAAAPMPGSLHEMDETRACDFQKRLYHEFQIEIPIMRWQDRCYMRVACQIYNQAAQYEKAADIIARLAASRGTR